MVNLVLTRLLFCASHGSLKAVSSIIICTPIETKYDKLCSAIGQLIDQYTLMNRPPAGLQVNLTHVSGVVHTSYNLEANFKQLIF